MKILVSQKSVASHVLFKCNKIRLSWLLIAKSPFFLLKSVFEQMFLSSEIEISKKKVANITVFVMSLHNKQVTLRVELQYVNEYLFN